MNQSEPKRMWMSELYGSFKNEIESMLYEDALSFIGHKNYEYE